MLKRLRYMFALVIISTSMLVAPVGAINPFPDCSSNPDTEVCKAAGSDNAESLIQQVINLLLFIIGTVAVIMIVIGGIKYTTSNGDSNRVTSAKNTVLYSVIGLAVAILASVIVNTVLDQFLK